MKKITFVMFLLLSGMMCMESLAATPKKVAVYVGGNISRNDVNIVNSAIMSRLSGNKDYVCFERNNEFIKSLIKEHDYQLSGEVPESEIRKVGERYGVDYVIAVGVVVKGDNTFMSARLINLETGEVLKTTNAEREGKDIGVLKALANNCAYRLISKKSK